MARIAITGSADGLGRLTADTLLTAGHEVVVHARSAARAEAIRDLQERGARVVTGDLALREQVHDVAAQINAIGPVDAVIHNAGVFRGASVMPVNVVAPYLLTALVPAARLVYLSSGMHRGGAASPNGINWRGTRETGSYSDSKLFVTALALTVATRWPNVLSNVVDPGWVPTRMGGANAPDDLTLGHRTQEWLATSDDADARTSGGYWKHQRRHEPHPLARSAVFQQRLLDALASETGVLLPAGV